MGNKEAHSMRLKKIAGKNYFVALMILLVAISILVIALFVANSLLPNALGNEPYQYEISSISYFEPWYFEAEDLEANFPRGGIILNINETDRFKTVILMGEGSFIKGDKTVTNEETSGLLMMIEHDLFDQIRGSNIFMPIEDQSLLFLVSFVFKNTSGVPNIWKDRIPLAFHGRQGLAFYYLLDPEGKPILPPSTNLTGGELYGTFLIYLLFILITIMTIMVFTLDHRYSRYWHHLAGTPPSRFALYSLLILIPVLALSDIVPVLLEQSRLFSFGGYGLILICLIIAEKYGKIDYLDLGLRRDRLRYGYVLALVTAAIIIISAYGLPAGLSLETVGPLLSLPIIFLLIGLPREMIWRGYIQAVLTRQLGINRGLLVMVLMASVVRFIFLISTEPWMLTYPYTYLEALILAPGLAAILGYLYLRTENVLACALLHSLIIWLPAIITY
jgi:membrane protease YdiL (CAAX protease family)